MFGFFVVEREEIGKKNDNWNLWILVFLVQKWPFRDAQLLFKKRAWNPYFYSVFWGERFLGQGVKKGKFWKATPKKEKFDW